MSTTFERFHDHLPELFALAKQDDATLLIQPTETGQGTKLTKINAFSRSYTQSSTSSISLAAQGLNGIADGLGLQASSYYNLWAIFNDTATELKGFSLTKQPKATTTAVSSGTKGSQATFTVASPEGYQFTVSSRVSVYVSESEWNTGTVASVSATSISVLMDNETYGNNITTSASTITQYNDFRPWHCQKSLSASEQTAFTTKYKLLSNWHIYSDSSSDLELVQDLGLGYNCYGWWDKSRYTHTLHPYYVEANGNYVINPLSPLVGYQTRDLLTDRRFIRADSTSGTTQADAFQGHRFQLTDYVGGTIRSSGTGSGSAAQTTVYSADASVNVNRTSDPITDGTNGTPRTDDETRPINISMIPIVRIIPI